ncbi:MAG: asparaginase [Chloroflexota bacterium]
MLPGAIKPGSPALGIAVKIADGDLRGRARPPVVLEILRQLNVLTTVEMETLSKFGPILPIDNWRHIIVGESRPSFELEFTPAS